MADTASCVNPIVAIACVREGNFARADENCAAAAAAATTSALGTGTATATAGTTDERNQAARPIARASGSGSWATFTTRAAGSREATSASTVNIVSRSRSAGTAPWSVSGSAGDNIQKGTSFPSFETSSASVAPKSSIPADPINDDVARKNNFSTGNDRDWCVLRIAAETNNHALGNDDISEIEDAIIRHLASSTACRFEITAGVRGTSNLCLNLPCHADGEQNRCGEGHPSPPVCDVVMCKHSLVLLLTRRSMV